MDAEYDFKYLPEEDRWVLLKTFIRDGFTDTPGTPLEKHGGELGADWES